MRARSVYLIWSGGRFVAIEFGRSWSRQKIGPRNACWPLFDKFHWFQVIARRKERNQKKKKSKIQTHYEWWWTTSIWDLAVKFDRFFFGYAVSISFWLAAIAVLYRYKLPQLPAHGQGIAYLFNCCVFGDILEYWIWMPHRPRQMLQTTRKYVCVAKMSSTVIQLTTADWPNLLFTRQFDVGQPWIWSLSVETCRNKK